MTFSSSPTPTPGLRIEISPYLREDASIIAALRQRAHNATRKPHQDAGGDAANFRSDFWGVLAELVVVSELERQGLRPAYVLFSHDPADWRKPDLTLNGHTIEIKACPPDKRYVTINAEQHGKQRTGYYLPVLFDSAEVCRIMRPVSWQSVSGWDYMTNAHSPYYSTARHNLRTLSNLTLLG